MNRATFIYQMREFLPESEVRQVLKAYLLAKKWHKGQFRKEFDENGNRLRYFEHLRRATLSLIYEAGVQEADVICATLLHDSVEDTEEIELIEILIEDLFGSSVATMVKLVTKVPKEGYIQRFIDGMPLTYGRHALVKAADRLDNLRTLPEDNFDFQKKQIVETRDVVLPAILVGRDHLPPSLVPCLDQLTSRIQTIVTGRLEYWQRIGKGAF